MGIISLEGLEFFAYHGYYEEERKIGNRYRVDISVSLDFSEAAQSDELEATLDYEALYKIAKQVMQKPTQLLEHLAQKIIDQIYANFPQVQMVEVAVAKQNPPIGGICQWAKIKLTK